MINKHINLLLSKQKTKNKRKQKMKTKIKSLTKDLTGEHETIRANRLSNREVVFTSSVQYSETAASSTSTKDSLIGPIKCDESLQKIDDPAVSASIASFTNENENFLSNESAMHTDVDDTALSQYELDVMSRYLKDLSENDDIDSDEVAIDVHALVQNVNNNIKNNVDEQLSKALSCHVIGCSSSDDDDGQKTTLNDHIDPTAILSNNQSDFESSNASSLIPVTDHADHTTDDSHCIQTSRQIGFDQNNQSNTAINQYTNNVCAADSILVNNNNDFNNNNLRISNQSGTNQSGSNIATTSTNSTTNRNTNRRFCDNINNNQRANTTRTHQNRLFGENLPIVVGITSCVWGLFFYAVKNLYSDLT